MVRKFLILGALTAAGLALAACDNPASGILSTAKTGDCFSVTGKDAYGQPKLIKTDCPAGTATGSTIPAASADQTAQADAKPADTKSVADASKASLPPLPVSTSGATSASTASVCTPAAPVCAAPHSYAVHTARYGKARHAVRYAQARRVLRTRRVMHRRHGKVVTEVVTEYVDASGHEYTTAGAYAAPPTTDTYVLGDHPPPPPAPPPVRDHREYYSGNEAGRYDSRSSQSYGSSSSSHYDSRSYSATDHRGPPPHPCNCDTRRAPPAPQYGPDGYLTWPNKSPY